MVLAGISGGLTCLHCDDGHYPNAHKSNGYLGCASCREMKQVEDVFPELDKRRGNP